MFRTVELPLWLFLLIIAFATVAFSSHFLFPSVRWFFRRRMEGLVARLNARLDRPIQPFKLMERQDMIIRLAHDPKVYEAISEEARATGEPETVVMERARRYAREIVPSFSARFYFTYGIRLARWFARLIYTVHLDDRKLGQIDPGATVVFVMNHRSNMDYVLVTYLAAERSALSYAVGEWARIWPLSWLIKTMGAYFIRRRSDRQLYRRVLSRYVQMATAEGVTQAIFPEGGLSLTGRTMAPKLGILSYITGAPRAPGRDVIFVPVALNYDRIVEDRVLIAAHAEGTRRFRARITGILAFIARHLWRALLGRFRGFGDAVVRYGTPISLSTFERQEKGDPTEALAQALMAEITRNIPVLAVPLVSAAWGAAEETDRVGLITRSAALADRLAAAGAELVLPAGGVTAAVDRTISIFLMRHMMERQGERLVLNPASRPILDFYAASILQLFDAAAETIGADPVEKPEKSKRKGHKITK
ncbi:1-acyl-sn-glycerol-3-phosphate acyltransferase [Frigidibacter sp. RF13]|uniref:1-acyl-sn-glycerol-3-phosphate acyltransferase n=1 Tax=Frigidibacter sp. RF13 TaxID=2997340 RepID=UPI00227022CC|nr:1-acyl-sn-glycerol-3-phosphate acyltransferase [Frigidibacter sp. RF13]MCY1126201.1 1-acyl-sn-glycerol-3-phosphate acyltransferase [Frigidibacter sp. RF13]